MQPDPIAYTIPDAVRASGFSRSRLDALAAEGRLTFRRAGRRTVIVADDLRAVIESLPPAPIRRRAKDAT